MPNISLQRTTSTHSDFISLVKLLDADLRIRDGNEHAFYAAFNKIDMINHVVIAYENSVAVGCGAVKQYEENIMEVKRMYVLPEHRNKNIATKVLIELEKWTSELGLSKCILETGIKQPEAIRLYEKNKYLRIPNYGQYENVANSVCFQKILSSQ